ncbi:MAG: type II secretion system protein [Planctomycetota bacterium]|jgi:prepilin-type N-terminal cleavage/methylation domain-containing protein
MKHRRAFTLVELPAVSRRERAAFTLVELLVVVGIIALLVTILMPSLNRAMELTRTAVCKSNQHSILTAIHLYLRDYNDALPYSINNYPQKGPNGENWSQDNFWYHLVGKIPEAQLLTHRSSPYTLYCWRTGYVDYQARAIGEDVFCCPAAARQVKPTEGNSAKYAASCSYSMNGLLSPDVNWNSPEQRWQPVRITEVSKGTCIMIGDARVDLIGGRNYRPLPRFLSHALAWGGPWPQQTHLGYWGNDGPVPEAWTGHLERSVFGCVDGHVEDRLDLAPEMFETEY